MTTGSRTNTLTRVAVPLPDKLLAQVDEVAAATRSSRPLTDSELALADAHDAWITVARW